MEQPTASTSTDQELASALYAVVVRLSRQRLDVPVDKAGLAVVHELHQLGTVRPSDLAARMRLDLSTISRHLRSLEQQGLVRRAADPEDARAQRVTLTSHGAEVLSRLLEVRAAAIRDAIDHWPQEDRAALHRLLRRLAGDLDRGAPPCGPVPTDDKRTDHDPTDHVPTDHVARAETTTE